jgi:hypothetical protein
VRNRIKAADKTTFLVKAEALLIGGKFQTFESRCKRVSECLSSLTQQLEEKVALIRLEKLTYDQFMTNQIKLPVVFKFE